MIQRLLLLLIVYKKYQSAISAGWLSGSLHSLTGADHITALLPLAVGKRWYISGLYGGIWGLGHGLCSFMLGYLGSYMKGYLISPSTIIENYRYVGDLVVAITVIIIGVMGIYENNEEIAETEAISKSKSSDSLTLSSSDPIANNSTPPVTSNKQSKSKKLLSNILLTYSIFVNGLCMGLSWDGLPSLAPALMLDNWLVWAFLLAYFGSTIVTMAITSSILGEVTLYIQQRWQAAQASSKEVDSPTVSQEAFSNHLAKLASYTACGIGGLWFFLACGKMFHHHFSTTAILPSEISDVQTEYSDDSMTSSVLCVGSLIMILSMLAVSMLSLHPQLRSQVVNYMNTMKRWYFSCFNVLKDHSLWTERIYKLIGMKRKQKDEPELVTVSNEVERNSINSRVSFAIYHHHMHQLQQVSDSDKFPIVAMV